MCSDARPPLAARTVTAPRSTRGSDEEEAALIAAVLRKDRKATATFVDRYADTLYGYVRQRLAPRADLVDDIVQEVFVVALRGLRGFEGRSSLRSWLLGIARHKVEDYYRHRLGQVDLDGESDSHVASVVHPEFEERLDQERQRDKTHRVLARLPEPYGLVLLWRYWEKRSTRDMAQRTGRTEKAIERLLARARAQFRARWEADEGAE